MSVTAPNQSGAGQNHQVIAKQFQNQNASPGPVLQGLSTISTSDFANQSQQFSNIMVSSTNPSISISPLINMVSQTSISNSNSGRMKNELFS